MNSIVSKRASTAHADARIIITLHVAQAALDTACRIPLDLAERFALVRHGTPMDGCLAAVPAQEHAPQIRHTS